MVSRDTEEYVEKGFILHTKTRNLVNLNAIVYVRLEC